MGVSLDGLPNFLGSKRDQAPAIFQKVAAAGFPPGQGHTFLDAFSGGGAVSLAGKALGYRVLTNDLAARSEAIGKGVIANRRTTLADEDVAYALTTDPAGWFLPSLKHLPWPEDSRRLLASIAKAAESYESVKRDLMRAWMVKFATSISIYGQPRMTAHQRIRDKNWDAMTPGQVERILGPQTRPRKMAQRAAQAINGAVFSNGQRNEAFRLDVLDFLAACTHDAQVVYLDPPYPDTEGYGRNYVGIDAILENRELEPDEGRFAAAGGWRFLSEALEACADVPLVVLSLGAEAKHVPSNDLEALMADAGRDVTIDALEYGLLRSRATAKSARKTEWLVTGTKT